MKLTMSLMLRLAWLIEQPIRLAMFRPLLQPMFPAMQMFGAAEALKLLVETLPQQGAAVMDAWALAIRTVRMARRAFPLKAELFVLIAAKTKVQITDTLLVAARRFPSLLQQAFRWTFQAAPFTQNLRAPKAAHLVYLKTRLLRQAKFSR